MYLLDEGQWCGLLLVAASPLTAIGAAWAFSNLPKRPRDRRAPTLAGSGLALQQWALAAVALAALHFATDIRMCDGPDCPAAGGQLMALPESGVPEVTVVTAGSRTYFRRLKNLAGSLHFWQPDARLLVYDIGLRAEQVREMSCWRGVEVVPFPFASFPAHVRNLYQYAWKVGVLQLALARLEANRTASAAPRVLLWLDTGVEVRQPLDVIVEIVLRDGVFSGTQSNTVGGKSAPETLRRLGVTREDMLDKPMCQSATWGLLAGHRLARSIIDEASRCAMDVDCIAPAGYGRANHNYEQSVLSALFWRNGVACQDIGLSTKRFSNMEMWRVPLARTACGEIVLSNRRWHEPKPYIGDVERQRGCEERAPSYEPDDEVVETAISVSRHQAQPMELCLAQNRTRRECLQLTKPPSQDEAVTADVLLWAALDWLFKAIFCLWTGVLLNVAAAGLAVLRASPARAETRAID
jgi:hypothetical protein